MGQTQEEKEKEEYQKKIDALLDEELKKNSKSNWLTRAFVDRPFIVIAVCSVVFIICTIATVAGKLMEMSENGDRDYLLWDNERTQDFDKFILI